MSVFRINPSAAYSFYKQFILDYSQDKSAIYEQYGFTLQGSVGSKDWEVFAAILMGDRASPGDGADLENFEVKSALIGNSFEYQYHRNRGLEKLQNERAVDHLFVVRSSTYKDVEVWLVERSELIATFDRWLPELQENYRAASRQRFRRSVTYRFVVSQGTKLMEIRNGALIEPV
ncbi:hypothetical protein [cf. Phormidesmis sp. LEGE 11477]|uniref:hypothetical protein n=1 Tax=cf. Phormidesmis sp. LEGE 11477 TaxID=1828680 RepID=UPI001D1562A2|nr:hypothetical protein [cf. Phormidesmis sp. LEGE 11477]